MDIVPDLNQNSLMSASKFSNENYITVLIPEEVLIYYGNEVKLRASGQEIFIGWRCKTSEPWRVTIKPKVENELLDTILLDHPDPGQFINNVYEIFSTEQEIKCLHICDGFPTKATWL